MALSTKSRFETGGNFGSPKIDLGGCVLYLPLWRQDQAGSPFQSKSAYGIPTLTCTVVGATWGIQGRVFDGDDQLNFASQVIPLGAKTICIWFKANAVTSDTLVDNCATAGLNHGTTVWIGNTGLLNFVSMKGVDGQNRFNFSSAAAVNDNIWHFVMCTWDGTTTANKAIIYIDGAQSATGTASATEVTSATNNLSIGNLGAPYTTGYFLTGSIGEVLLYSRALTQAEGQHIRQETKWRYF